MKEPNIKEEVYKCSKCGQCQSVCPVYLATKNEMYLARGRYNVLNNFFNNDTKFSKKFINDLDICLNCNLCKNFCPSSIDSEEIFTSLKNKYYKPLIAFSIKFKLILFLHSLKRLFIKNSLYTVTTKHKKIGINNEKAEVVYFQGCFNKYINPSDKNASLNLLEANGYKVIKTLDNCCGNMYYSGGELNKFSKNAEKITKLIPEEAQYIVCSCDSCFNTLKKAFENTPVKNKLIRLDELIKTDITGGNIVFHKPLNRAEFNRIEPDKILNKKGTSALMENYFLLKHPYIASKMLETIFYKKEEANNKTVVTTCNLAKWGLIKGFEKNGANTKVSSYSEYISNLSSDII